MFFDFITVKLPVGANAVVLQDVPPYATAVGIPARIITAQEKEEKQRQD